MTNESRKYSITIKSRACENFGAVNYTITETLTVKDGGLQVDTHSVGWSEGERVDQRASKFWPNVTIEAAHNYRMRAGYTEIVPHNKLQHIPTV